MSTAMDRLLERAAAGPVSVNANDFAVQKLAHRGFVAIDGYRPGRLRQTFALTQRGRDELARREKQP